MDKQINIPSSAEITFLESEAISQLSKVVFFRALEWDRRLIGKWVVSSKAKPNSNTVNYFHLEQTDNGILVILMDDPLQLQPYHLSTLNRIDKNLTDLNGNVESFVRTPDSAVITDLLSLPVMILAMMGWKKSQIRYPNLCSTNLSTDPKKDDEFRFRVEGHLKKGSKKKIGSINIDLRYEGWESSHTKVLMDRIFESIMVKEENRNEKH